MVNQKEQVKEAVKQTEERAAKRPTTGTSYSGYP